MSSVTGRIKSIRQPYGGYLPVKSFIVKQYDDGKILNPKENVHASLVGLAVDYLTRYTLTKDLEDSFRISLSGAEILNNFVDGVYEYALGLLKDVAAGDISSAVKLASFDSVYRAGIASKIPSPDAATIENIKIMVERGVKFLKQSSLTKAGFTFEGGYTDTVDSGDGDYLTADALVDFKVLRGKINSQYTLQLLMYYLMGVRSIHPEFKNVKYLTIFNPRKNLVYYADVRKIPQSVIDKVSREVIGYRN